MPFQQLLLRTPSSMSHKKIDVLSEHRKSYRAVKEEKPTAEYQQQRQGTGPRLVS